MAAQVEEAVWFGKGWGWRVVVYLLSVLLSFRLGDGATFVNVGIEGNGEDDIVLSAFVKVAGIKYREFSGEIMLTRSIEEYREQHWEICVNNSAKGYGGRTEYCLEAFNDKISTSETEEDVDGSMDWFSLFIVQESGIQHNVRKEANGTVLECSQAVLLRWEAEMEAAATNGVVFLSNPETSSYLRQSKMMNNNQRKRKRKGTESRPYGPAYASRYSPWYNTMKRDPLTRKRTRDDVLNSLPEFVEFVNKNLKEAIVFLAWAVGEKGQAWIQKKGEDVKEKEVIAGLINKGFLTVVDKTTWGDETAAKTIESYRRRLSQELGSNFMPQYTYDEPKAYHFSLDAKDDDHKEGDFEELAGNADAIKQQKHIAKLEVWMKRYLVWHLYQRWVLGPYSDKWREWLKKKGGVKFLGGEGRTWLWKMVYDDLFGPVGNKEIPDWFRVLFPLFKSTCST